MWNRLWCSLGKTAAFAAKSVGGAPGPEKPTGRGLRERIQTDLVTALLSLAAARLCGAASGALRKRAILICVGIQGSINALGRALSIRRRLSPSIKAVREQAERIAQVLAEQDITLNRIGIDGVPGSGKSTLARTLAERLDMRWESLDRRNLRLPGNLSSERTVYEHHRLFRTQDVDAFDVMIYIDEPVELSRAKVRGRGRGLVLAAILDYDKLKKVGKLAFDVCDGEPVSIPDGHLVLKVKPRKGFHAVESIASRLSAAGSDTSALRQAQDAGVVSLSNRDMGDMSKEEMLLLLACGRPQEGLTAYLLPLVYVARIGKLAAALRSAARSFVTVWRADDSAGDLGGQTKMDRLAAT